MADYVILSSNGGYVVKDRATGKNIGEPHGSVAEAAAARRELRRRAASSPRPCITCEKAFLSEGPHHRMCASCRTLSADAPFEIGHRRARIGVRS
ncbi:hypothetical protein [Sagittula salina]|uniref:Uncharacterized protein n=1 Tax=Sagittula salina TaxID=2820268 RepID=A0A940MU32_9RHOB|nr:hypothetical protein [Sagittula salina]MBP0483972.1 hypothetical protein [Sagittula salina]